MLTAQSASPWQSPPGWADTRGGEGGAVVKVTTLARSGPGSIQEALKTKGRKVIEFTVGGVIDLEGEKLKIQTSGVTIAGETAPSPGITFIKGGIMISANDVVLRHLRVRVGEAGHAKKSGWELDGISLTAAHNVIVDHCSIAWATDENLSASGPRFEGANPEKWRKNTSSKVTFSHCIVAEGLKDSTHRKGVHSMGSLVHDNASDIFIYQNLYISNNERNPLFKGGARGAVVNNLIVNSGSYGFRYILVESEWAGKEWQMGKVSLVGNHVKKGPNTKKHATLGLLRGPCEIYAKDNLVFDLAGKSVEPELKFEASKEGETVAMPRSVDSPELWIKGLKPLAATQVEAEVLKGVGARPWERDRVDQRLVEEARLGKGKIIDSEEQVGGYRVLGDK